MRINEREDEYKCEFKIRYTRACAEPLDFAAEARVLLYEMKLYDKFNVIYIRCFALC